MVPDYVHKNERHLKSPYTITDRTNKSTNRRSSCWVWFLGNKKKSGARI